jgi:hypothetical protein
MLAVCEKCKKEIVQNSSEKNFVDLSNKNIKPKNRKLLLIRMTFSRACLTNKN